MLLLISTVSCASPASPGAPAVSTTPAGRTSTSQPLPTRQATPAIPSSTRSVLPIVRAGLRSSSYGISPFPGPDWWLSSARSMASRFDRATPAVVWIVGVVDDGHCWLSFPAPADGAGDYPNILFSAADANEAYLDLFDRQGVAVWLQVEPADADVSTLIDLVLGRYASHPSVVGFGLDDEWYKDRHYREGKAVTDVEAQSWVAHVRAYNPSYLLFIKHWLVDKLPPTYRDGILFLDDSQQLESLAAMVDEFQAWGRAFAPAPVGFQFGYPDDRRWWGHLADPPGEIGRALAGTIPNLADLYWVDFTAAEIWPQRE
jgi:hypothetical protein